MFVTLSKSALVAIALVAAVQTAKAEECAKGGPVELCVVSAALTSASRETGPDRRLVKASVTLKATNTSDASIDVALVGGYWGAWSFTPKNAEAIVNRAQPTVSGIQVCSETRGCSYTSLSPQTSLIAQIQYTGIVSTVSLPSFREASTAAFTTSMIVSEGGSAKVVSFALDGLSFGNSIPTE